MPVVEEQENAATRNTRWMDFATVMAISGFGLSLKHAFLSPVP